MIDIKSSAAVSLPKPSRCAEQAQHSHFKSPGADLRLMLEHVETSRGYATPGERLRERSFIDHGAAGSADQDRCRLHHTQLWLADVVLGFGGERNVQADEVGFGKYPLLLTNLAG